jgi:hypothetical protein
LLKTRQRTNWVDGRPRSAAPTMCYVANTILMLMVVCVSAAQDTQGVADQAQKAYYSLYSRGFKGFTAAVEPNWEVILGKAATTQNLKVFRALHFTLAVDSRGTAVVTYQAINPDKVRLEPYARQIHANVEGLVNGFFSTWSTFVVSSPFPIRDAQTKIENGTTEHRLFFKTRSADAILTLTNDLLISELKLIGPSGKRTIKPAFQKTTEGFLLSSFTSTFEPTSEGLLSTTLDVQIEHQQVTGMRLPQKVRIKGMHGSEPIEAELTFTQCVLNPR